MPFFSYLNEIPKESGVTVGFQLNIAAGLIFIQPQRTWQRHTVEQILIHLSKMNIPFKEHKKSTCQSMSILSYDAQKGT